MQKDFHYYATYAAAYIAGYSHEECLVIAYSANFVDHCTRTFLSKIGGPNQAATTQLSLEMMDARTDIIGLQDITRIWASFHFLPKDLYAPVKGSKRYKNKYRLICGPNSDLIEETVKLAQGQSLQAVGVAMHVLADTWAHRNFAGTPSLVINNVASHIFELIETDGKPEERRITFRHSGKDDLEGSKYINTIYQNGETSIMSLGHGRAGHLPDYSFARYKYLPAWGNYEEILKDNPSDYYHAFCQMVYALKSLRSGETFVKDTYDWAGAEPWKEEIQNILVIRQIDACKEWKAFGEKLSGCSIDDFEIAAYEDQYIQAAKDDKDKTFIGKFILAAMAQKSMVTNKIYKSGNVMAGISIDYDEKGFKGIRDFIKLVEYTGKEAQQ